MTEATSAYLNRPLRTLAQAERDRAQSRARQTKGATMRYGTSHFTSHAAAIDYYSDYESDPVHAVARKLEVGEIHIGPPELKPGQRLLYVDSGRRYAVEDNA